MSAALDTVVHDVLLNRLANRFGVRDVVLSWFSLYLTNRKQLVGINESSLCLVNLDVGVPQGSVLGPLLYLLYTSPLADNLLSVIMSVIIFTLMILSCINFVV